MSASKDKILRKQQIEAGTDKRSIAAAEAAKKRRKSNITYTIVAVALVIVFAFIFIYNSTFQMVADNVKLALDEYDDQLGWGFMYADIIQ